MFPYELLRFKIVIFQIGHLKIDEKKIPVDNIENLEQLYCLHGIKI